MTIQFLKVITVTVAVAVDVAAVVVLSDGFHGAVSRLLAAAIVVLSLSSVCLSLLLPLVLSHLLK